VDGRDICANPRKTRFALLPGHDNECAYSAAVTRAKSVAWRSNSER
jgi:hypothetical protein